MNGDNTKNLYKYLNELLKTRRDRFGEIKIEDQKFSKELCNKFNYAKFTSLADGNFGLFGEYELESGEKVCVKIWKKPEEEHQHFLKEIITNFVVNKIIPTNSVPVYNILICYCPDVAAEIDDEPCNQTNWHNYSDDDIYDMRGDNDLEGLETYTHFSVYECVRGNLTDFNRKINKLDKIEKNFHINNIIYQFCIIMEKLHNSDHIFLHNDTKSDNFVINEDNTLKLIDYGISKLYFNLKGNTFLHFFWANPIEIVSFTKEKQIIFKNIYTHNSLVGFFNNPDGRLCLIL